MLSRVISRFLALSHSFSLCPHLLLPFTFKATSSGGACWLATGTHAIYHATIQAVCYGTRHIIETITARGHSVNGLTVCGGITNSRLFLQTQADVLQMEIAVPQERESVLLGAAMLGMAASGDMGDLHQVVSRINIKAEMVQPSSSQSSFHDAKYLVFREMIKDQLKYNNIMENI